MGYAVDLRQLSAAHRRLGEIVGQLSHQSYLALETTEYSGHCVSPAGTPVAGPLKAAVETFGNQMSGVLHVLMLVLIDLETAVAMAKVDYAAADLNATPGGN